MRNVNFTNGEYYHIYNRGVDKRRVFMKVADMKRFFQGMEEFNVVDPIGSIYQNNYRKKHELLSNSATKSIKTEDKLVTFVCYCLNLNHYHFILRQEQNKGIEKFMHKLGSGYTRYFNEKNDRSGALFQGRYKAAHINSNNYLLHLSVYVNLNYIVHGLSNSVTKSSWIEYLKGGQNGKKCFCDKKIVLSQFADNPREYKEFAERTIKNIKDKRMVSEIFLE